MFNGYKKIIIVLFISLSIIGCSSGTNGGNIESSIEIEVVDMAGRTVIMPKTVDKVFAVGPEGTIMLYTLNPNKMAGWNYELREGEKQFILERYHNLPNLGGAGKESINIEEVLKADPDILIMLDTINDTSIAKADEMEKQIDIPLLLIDVDINNIPEAYEFLAKIIGEEEKGKKLAGFCKETLNSTKEKISNILEDKKIRIYYAEGPIGLQTEPAGSWHGELIEMAGGINVAEVAVKEGKGKSEVSMEQLLSWDPDLIISWDDERGGYYSKIFNDPKWKHIKAVQNKEIYETPNKPFNWFDRPPSVNRILGLKWMGNLLYPELFDYDMEKEAKEFYEEFYHYELSEEEISDLLLNSIRGCGVRPK